MWRSERLLAVAHLIIIILEFFVMQLPQIIEDQKALKSDLIELIQQRYELTLKESKFNFLKGEYQMINAMGTDDQLIKLTHDLLALFLSNQIQNGYCYYTLKSILNRQPSETVSALASQLSALSEKKSQYNSINHLILMREILLSKLQGKAELNKQVYQFIDDIRFINEEIIKAINAWREELRKGKIDEHIVFVYKGQNYMTKMITDNEGILESLNQKNSVFLRKTNPFFITSSGNVPGMSESHINQILEFLSEEKAKELKMMIESPFLKSQKGIQLESELRQIKIKGEDNKIQQIRTIYNASKTNFKQFSKADKIETADLKIEKMVDKNQNSIKNLEKLIKEKEIKVLQQMKKKKVDPYKQSKQKESTKNSSLLGYKSKLQNLKNQIEKNVKLNRQKQKKKEPLPKSEAEIKSSKPKIKIIREREVQVEETVKGIFGLVMEEKGLGRSRSTFYKGGRIEDEQKQQQSPSKNVMISSAYSFKSLPNKTRGSSFNITLRKSKVQKEVNEKEKSQDASLSREKHMNQIKQSLTALNNRIRETSIRSIYSSRSTTHNKTSTYFNKKHSRSKEKEEQPSLTNPNQTKDQSPLKNKLTEKQKHIEELKQKLRELRSIQQYPIKGEISAIKGEENNMSLKEKFKDERSKLQLQNLRIKEQMKKQELKYLSLKEREYKLREEEMQNRYKRQLQKIKEGLVQKQKQFQTKVAEEKRKNREIEEKLREAAKRSETIKLELQEKEIKQQLFQELIRQEAQRKKREAEERESQIRKDVLIEQFEREQEKYRKELERKAMEVFEIEKLKLQEMHIQIKQKNAELQQLNQQRLHQIQLLQAEARKEEQQLKHLQGELDEKLKEEKLKAHLEEESIGPSKEPQIDQYELEELKEKVKKELLEEIIRKRQEEEEQERKYAEARRKHLSQLEDEIRKAMQLEDQQMKKIQQEYRIKNEQMLKQYEEEMRAKEEEKKKIQQESERRIQEVQYKQPFQMEKLVNIETGLDQPLPLESLSKEGKKVQEVEAKSELHRQQLNKVIDKSDQPQPKIRQNQQILRQESQPEILQNVQNKLQQSPSKLPPEPSKVVQQIPQNITQISKKYDSLLSMVSKPIKQIFISFDDIELYLNKYFSSLSPQIKEMLPFSKKDLVNILKLKKVDVFDNYSFGWYRAKQKKYMLIGSYQTIPLVGAKYGEIQVQQVFLFSKNNAYQKQFLSKLIKIYEKIGYIYQKKTGQENKYSIKFIVKIPKSNNSPQISDQLELTNKIIFEEHSENHQQGLKKNCTYYLLAQGLAEYLSKEQKIQLASRQDLFSKTLNKKINEQGLNTNWVRTEQINHKITELSISLPLEYLQTEEQAFFFLRVKQYELQSTQQKLYIAMYDEEKIAVVVHKMKQTEIPKDFHLDSYLQAKLKRLEEDKETKLFLPVWNNSVIIKSRTLNSFTSKQSVKSNLSWGSVVKSNVHKGDFFFLQPPFAFIVFEINSAKMLRRIIFGQIVQTEDLYQSKKSVITV